MRPNLLLVTTDQQRRDTIGPRAPEFLRTPHLDQLAREGARFDAAYAATPVCVPSRISILTGQSSVRHGMTTNGATSEVLPPSAATLPARLSALGYATVGIGKMHFTPPRARHGFEELILPDDYYRTTQSAPMRHGLGQNELFPGMATVPEAETLTSWLSERAVDHIHYRRDPTRPMFMWLSYSKPHPPLDPPEPYYSMYVDAPIADPVVGDWVEDAPAAFARVRQRGSFDLLDAATIRAARAAYYGLVTQIDYNLGRVLGALQDVDELRNTMIVFTSDHGEFLGDHGTGNKIFFHEPSSGIPMIVRPPAADRTLAPGTVVSTPVTLADVLPTLVAAAGGAVGNEVEGTDLVELAVSGRRDRLVVGVAHGDAGPANVPYYLAVTDGRLKYIWYPEGPAEQLFDLEADPLEQHDLTGRSESAGLVLEWRDVLRSAVRDAGGEHLLDGDELPKVAPLGDTPSEQRATAWPGYHTDRYSGDVRH